MLLLLGLALTGCRPGAGGASDEQKDPYYLAGKNRLQEIDYPGAIEMFEKALDVNPRSASAHFELGVLYEQRQGDYAAALYHYQKAVNLRADLLSADLARQRIQECKRELAKSVVQPISMENMQRELDTLRAENQSLKLQLQAAQNGSGGRGPLVVNSGSSTANPAPRSGSSGSPAHLDPPVTPRPETPVRSNPPPVSRTHSIASGDTPASIARKYGVKLSALENANPTMDARRLRPGQSLVIPPP